MEQLERELGLIPESDPSPTTNSVVPSVAHQTSTQPTISHSQNATTHFIPTHPVPLSTQQPILTTQQSNLPQNLPPTHPQNFPQKQPHYTLQGPSTYNNAQPMSVPLSTASPQMPMNATNPPPAGPTPSWGSKQQFMVHPVGAPAPTATPSPTPSPKAAPKVTSTITSLPPPLPMPNFNRTAQPSAPSSTKAAPPSTAQSASKKAPPASAPSPVKVEEKDEAVVAAAAVDRHLALQPNYMTSFLSEDDAWQRLIAYHVFNTPDIKTLVPPIDPKVKAEETKKAEVMVKRAEALRAAFSARLRKEAENSQKAETLLINRLCFYDEKLEFDNLKKAAAPLGTSPALAKAAVPRPGTPQTPQSPTARPISSPGPTYAKAPLPKAAPSNVSLNSPQPQLVMNSPVSMVGKQPPSYAVNVVSVTPTATLASTSTISTPPTSGNVSTPHSAIPPASSQHQPPQASPLGGG